MTPDVGTKCSAFAVPDGRAIDDRTRLQHLAERLEDEQLALLHSRGEKLHAENIAAAIDDEPRNEIAFRMHEAVAGGGLRLPPNRSRRARSSRARNGGERSPCRALLSGRA